MSTAPRPHTSSTPSALRTSSPPNGSRCQPAGVDRHDVGVAHQAQARRGRVAALDAGRRTTPGPASAPSARSSTPGALDVGLQHVGVAGLLARRRRAVVDAAVADQRLQQLDGGGRQVTSPAMASLGAQHGRPGAVSAAARPTRSAATATTLELLFDLCFVVAVAQAAPSSTTRSPSATSPTDPRFRDAVHGSVVGLDELHVVRVRPRHGRCAVPVLTFVQMTGALVVAAGVHDAFDGRLSGDRGRRLRDHAPRPVVQWFASPATSRASGPGRSVRLDIAVAAGALGAWLVCRRHRPVVRFVLMASPTSLVPCMAERRRNAPLPRRAHCRALRPFTIIVLGESILAATSAVQQAIAAEACHVRDPRRRLGGLVIVFSCGGCTSPARARTSTDRTALRRGATGTCRSSLGSPRSAPASRSPLAPSIRTWR